MKELNRSIIPTHDILDFFVRKELNRTLSENNGLFIGNWFKSLENRKYWPSDLELASYIMTVMNAVTMDVYAAARMFKVFNLNDSEHNYPKEPHNIIYYAGTGHTHPMGRFLKTLGFQRTEYSNMEILSCASMREIKQPLFT